jgi:hypothetical protein
MKTKTFEIYLKESNMNIPTFDDLWNALPDEVIIPNWKRGDVSKKINIKQELKDCIQDSKHHAEGSVFSHLRLIYNQIIHNFKDDAELPYLLLSLMFHDIAKPEAMEQSFRPDGSKKISHIGHDHIAIKYMDIMLKDYIEKLKHKFPDLFKNIDIDIVKETVKEHMRSHLYFNTLSGKSLQPVNLSKQKWVDFPKTKHFGVLKKFSHSDEHGRYLALQDSDIAEEEKEDELGNRIGYMKKDYTNE